MTVIRTWIDEPWRMPPAEGESEMRPFTYTDVDGDKIAVSPQDVADENVFADVRINPHGGSFVPLSAYLSRDSARELRDWLTELLGDAVEAEPGTSTEERVTALQTARRITGSGNAETLIDLAEWILGDVA